MCGVEAIDVEGGVGLGVAGLLRGGEDIGGALALGIDAQGGLRVRRDDGTQDVIRTGEVSVRGLFGYA